MPDTNTIRALTNALNQLIAHPPTDAYQRTIAIILTTMNATETHPALTPNIQRRINDLIISLQRFISRTETHNKTITDLLLDIATNINTQTPDTPK